MRPGRLLVSESQRSSGRGCGAGGSHNRCPRKCSNQQPSESVLSHRFDLLSHPNRALIHSQSPLTAHRKNLRPAFPPTLWIHQTPPTAYPFTQESSTLSPFENLAPAPLPLIAMSWTVASWNDFRNSDDGGVQFLIVVHGARRQLICSQPGWVI